MHKGLKNGTYCKKEAGINKPPDLEKHKKSPHPTKT